MSRYLLDTNALVFFMQNSHRLKAVDRNRIANPDNTIYVSAVSFIEIAIKVSINKLDLGKSVLDLVADVEALGMNVADLGITTIAGLEDMSLFHRDPFDRLLILHARELDATFLTSDKHLLLYFEYARILRI